MDIPASSPCYLLLFGVCCTCRKPLLMNFVPIFLNKAKQSIKFRRRDIFIKSHIQKEYFVLGCYKRPSCTTHHTGRHNAECCRTRHIQTLPYKHKSTAAASAEKNTPVFFSWLLFQSGSRRLWSFWSESSAVKQPSVPAAAPHFLRTGVWLVWEGQEDGDEDHVGDNRDQISRHV